MNAIVNTTLESYLHYLLGRNILTKSEAEEAMTLILEEADPHQIVAFVSLLKYRGETPEEMAGMVTALERKAVPVDLAEPVLEIVGTGGDRSNTVNISTGAAILAAACGVPIAKHGNRSVSSRSGSADVLEALGLEIEIPPIKLRECLHETNIAFMFAPYYHPSFKKLGAIRKGLKLPTVFNMLGPLLNPAKAEYALVGVANEFALDLISKVILELGSMKRALVFHGGGVDELTTLGPISAYDIYEGKRHRLEIDPRSLGFTLCALEELQGGDAMLNASILKEIFAGQSGAIAEALAFTAGAGLWIFNRTPSLLEGIQVARKALQEGKALEILEKWKAFSHRLRTERN